MDDKKKRIVVSLIGLLLGAVGVFLLINYVQGADERAQAEQQLVEVYVADQVIPVNTPATDLEALVRLDTIPLTARNPNAITDLAALGSLVLQERILPGEQILEDRFAETESRVLAGSDSEKVPDGLFEVTFSISAERAVGGQIEPNEKIAIVSTTADGVTGIGSEVGDLSFSRFVLRDVLIVNIQSNQFAAAPVEGQDPNERSRAAPAGEFFITVALSPENAQRLIFAKEKTSLWLVREPEIPPDTPDSSIDFANLFGEGVLDSEIAEQLAAVDATSEAVAADTPEPDEPPAEQLQ